MDLTPSTSTTPHLSFPALSIVTDDADSALAGPSTTVQKEKPRQVLKDRLYVGNLAPTVDEYTLLQVFSKFGKISKLDYLFHKAGPHKGKPRGYAFVQYASHDDASKAMSSANDKLLRGRKLVVTFAQQAPVDTDGASRYRKTLNDASRPTALSLMKSASTGRIGKTHDRIAKMEAKLQQLQSTPAVSPQLATAHPSLPLKPSPLVISAASESARATSSASSTTISATPMGDSSRVRAPITRSIPPASFPKPPLISRPSTTPSVTPTPARPGEVAGGSAGSTPTSSSSASTGARPKTKASLTGIRIGKGPVPGLKKG